jgi:hypothetical protein
MPTGLTPQKRLLSHPSEKLIRRGGVDIKWNGPKLNKAGIQSFMVTEVVSENEKAQYHISVFKRPILYLQNPLFSCRIMRQE